MLGRHETREAAFQALFALNANPEADRDAVYTAVLPEDETPSPYLQTLVTGVLDNQTALDSEITSRLKAGWQLSRLSKPALIVLRLGLYEIQYETDLPDRVAINEAIELAKKYDDDQGAKFVNGILAHYVKSAD
ncbi:transcription antitermination factor NusB [Lacticaseibacillus brantae]|uniref:Transcription antitermination protein NusB n=1 Tax=Lacticaseibacillus brantae DSM 23927 TaxID=1423727 RepID=A0A0R2B181_9LACO|nr:transcription antitermination factor NusB [Lacticaseibacillus brantae]KRM72821.1 transcription antitermination protein NusB [Lacticaseibacillus brantae DSM 23927]